MILLIFLWDRFCFIFPFNISLISLSLIDIAMGWWLLSDSVYVFFVNGDFDFLSPWEAGRGGVCEKILSEHTRSERNMNIL